jgi:hypothetical protein
MPYRNRFNLREDSNPFRRDFLDCIQRNLDHDAFVRVGRYRLLAEASGVVCKAAEADAPCFLLITGPDGAGRTSIANCLIHEYAVRWRARHLPPDPAAAARQPTVPLILRPRMGEPGKDRDFLSRWLGDIDDLADRNTAITIREDRTPSKLREQFRTLRDDTAAEDLSTGVARLVRDVNRSGFGLATVVEKIHYAGYITSLFTMLSRAPALTIFTGTTLGELGARLQLAFDSCRADAVMMHHVSLSAATGETMRELVRTWWQRAAEPEHPMPPIDLDGVADGFAPELETVGRALRILAYMIDDLSEQPGAYDRAQTSSKIKRFRENALAYVTGTGGGGGTSLGDAR